MVFKNLVGFLLPLLYILLQIDILLLLEHMDEFRQAVQMIDLLINEVDTHVSEIIERVQLESNNSSTGPTSRTVSPVATIMQQSATTALTSKEFSVSRTQPPLQVSNAIVTTSNLSQSSNTSTNTNAAMKTPNVWQQRAAKLQQQKSEIV